MQLEELSTRPNWISDWKCINATLHCSNNCTHLIHASSIESHDRGMCQSIKHSSHCFLRVEFLWFEYLIHISLVEHRTYDVIQHCNNRYIITRITLKTRNSNLKLLKTNKHSPNLKMAEFSHHKWQKFVREFA